MTQGSTARLTVQLPATVSHDCSFVAGDRPRARRQSELDATAPMPLRAKPEHFVLAALPTCVHRLPLGFSRRSPQAPLVGCQALPSAPTRSNTAQERRVDTGPTGT